MKKKQKTRARLSIKPQNLWVGVYVDKTVPAVYVCVLPTVCLKIWRETVAYCPTCGSEAFKTAYHTGDGWALAWSCTDDLCDSHYDDLEEIPWPFAADWANVEDLERVGFTIVP